MYLVQEAGDSDDWYYTLDRHIDFTWNSPSYKGIKLGNNVQISPETQTPIQQTPNENNTDKSLPKNLVSTFVHLAVLLAAVCAFVLKRD